MSSSSNGDLAHLVGVVEPIKFPENTRFMFPSKVGGAPAWLVPQSLPQVDCDSCATPMTFLLQLYAPDQDCEQAFHRSLMVFVCTKCRCFLKCFRSQLPLINRFYGTELASPADVPLEDEISQLCCETCGCATHRSNFCRALPEYGIAIDELDEMELDDVEEEEESESESDDDSDMMASMMPNSDMAIDRSEMDLFKEFTETQIEKDSSFRLFKRFVQEAPSDHVIYYSIGGSPMWITEENQMPGPPPACQNCGTARHFEFQIQPQLIYHLMKKLPGLSMNAAPFEWGVVAVYTCTQNCTGSSPYQEEFLYNQLEPSEWLEFNSRKKVDFSKESKTKDKAPMVAEADDNDEGEWM